jgi:hypothetical protein
MNRPITRRLGFETLESRTMLAGNVAAEVSDGVLSLTGNYQQNMIVIWGGQNEGEVVIAGAKDYVGGNTLVNNSVAPVTVSGVRRIFADMRSGDDRILVTNLSLPVDEHHTRRAFYMEAGDGDDQLVFSGDTGSPRQFTLNQEGNVPYGLIDIKGSVFMAGHRGDDVLSVVHARINGVVMYGQDGNDALRVDGVPSENRINFIRVNMGTGNDVVSIRNVQLGSTNVVGSIHVHRGTAVGGSSSIELFNVQARPSLNLDLRQDRAGSTVRISTHPWNRTVFHGGSTDITLGEGTSSVTIQRAQFLTLTVRGSRDADVIELDDVVLSHTGADLNVFLRSGDDVLRVRNVSVRSVARFDGGEGHDRYIDAGENSFGGLNLSNFEEEIQE